MIFFNFFNPLFFVRVLHFYIATETALLIGSGIAAGASAVNAGMQGIRGKKNRELQKQINAQNQANWREQFDYQKYLNANQYQIMASDARAAGINPIAAAGGSVSGFSGQAGLDSSPSEAPQIDTSVLSSIYQDAMNVKAQKEMQSKQIEAQKEMQREELDFKREELQFQKDKAKNELDEQISNNAANIQLQKDLQRIEHEWSDSSTHREALNNINSDLEKLKRETVYENSKVLKYTYKVEDGHVKRDPVYKYHAVYDDEGHFVSNVREQEYYSGSEFAQDMQNLIQDMQAQHLDFTDSNLRAWVQLIIGGLGAAAGLAF